MILFENSSNNAAFWFAAEEYVMRVLKPQAPVLMFWSTEDTVMIGANQIVRAECDMAYAKSAGIEIVRRPSGGGAIYTDRGALQYTVILPYGTESRNEAFVPGAIAGDSDCGPVARPREYCDPRAIVGDSDCGPVARPREHCDPRVIAGDWLAAPIVDTLTGYGVRASLEGRNDVVVDGKKISGIAQHVQGGYICSHCSLLFCADLEHLENVLSVDREKIETKAIASVRARVMNISDHTIEKDIGNFRRALIESCGRMGAMSYREFDADDLRKINAIMQERYANFDWIFGREPAFTYTNRKRFPGGLIEVFLNIKGGVIRNVKISGDFLALRPTEELEEALENVPHRKESLAEAIQRINVAAILGSLGADELLEVLA